MEARWQKTPRIEGKAADRAADRARSRAASCMLITSAQLRAAGVSREDGRIVAQAPSSASASIAACTPPILRPSPASSSGWRPCSPAVPTRCSATSRRRWSRASSIPSPSPPTSPCRAGAGRTRTGIVVHRSSVDPRDRRQVGAIPCTSADRILVDLAPDYEEPELEVMLVAAESLGLIKRGRLARARGRAATARPGMARLAGLLNLDPIEVRSPPEVLLLPICRMTALPRPQLQPPGRRPDAVAATHRRSRLAGDPAGDRARQPALPRRLGPGGG